MDDDSSLPNINEGTDIDELERRLHYQGLQIRLLWATLLVGITLLFPVVGFGLAFLIAVFLIFKSRRQLYLIECHRHIFDRCKQRSPLT